MFRRITMACMGLMLAGNAALADDTHLFFPLSTARKDPQGKILPPLRPPASNFFPLQSKQGAMKLPLRPNAAAATPVAAPVPVPVAADDAPAPPKIAATPSVALTNENAQQILSLFAESQ